MGSNLFLWLAIGGMAHLYFFVNDVKEMIVGLSALIICMALYVVQAIKQLIERDNHGCD